VRLAEVLAESGRAADADELLRRALAAERASLGGAHPEVGRTLDRLGRLRLRMGDVSGGRQALEEALAVYARGLGPAHPWAAAARATLDSAGDPLENRLTPP
jgi:Tetratricopeptide repeat